MARTHIDSCMRMIAAAFVFAMVPSHVFAEEPDGSGAGDSPPHLGCAADHADPSYKARTGRPRIDLLKPEILGALDKEIVRRIARHNMSGLHVCYRQTLLERPTTEGVVEVQFLIGPQGNVMFAAVQSDSTRDPKLRLCVEKEIREWLFPKPKGSTVQVTYPIRFYLEVSDEKVSSSSSSSSWSYGGGATSSSGQGNSGTQGFGGVGTAREDAVYCEAGASEHEESGEGGEVPRIIARPVTVGPGGALSKEVIRRVIRKHEGEVSACYARRMVRQSEGGKVKVEFHIDGKGRVTSSSVIDNTLNDGRVEDCLVDAIRTWRFPEPKGGGKVIVKYPFDFSPVTPAQLAREDAEREK